MELTPPVTNGSVTPTGGGGRVGLLLLSSFVKAGTENTDYYNHFSLLRSWDATTVSFFAVFTPMIAIALGAVILGERLSVWSIAGSALILVGVSMTLLAPRAASPAPTS